MAKIKIFVLDSECGQYHGGGLARAVINSGKELGKDVEIKVSIEKLLANLPRYYDTYLLHLSNTIPEDIIKLREEQPWSRIDAITGARSNIPSSIMQAVNRIHGLFCREDYENIVNNPRTD